MANTNEDNRTPWVDDRLATLTPADDWQPDPARGLRMWKERRRSEGVQVHRWAWAAGAVAVACIGLAIFPVTRAFAQRCVDACVGGTTRLGGLLWNRPSETGIHAASTRRPAPDFTLSDAAGNPVKLSDFKGKAVLLNFWATWCAPCKVEIPWFDEFQREHAGLAVLGVSLDDDGWKSVAPYIKDHAVHYRVMIGNDQIARLYGGVQALPTTVIIDKWGRIAAMHEGLTSKTDYEAEILAMLGE